MSKYLFTLLFSLLFTILVKNRIKNLCWSKLCPKLNFRQNLYKADISIKRTIFFAPMLSTLEGFHCIIISTIIIIFNCTVLFLVDIVSSVKSSLRLSSIKLSSLNKKPQTESTFLSVCAVLRMADFRRTRMSVWISYCFKKYFSCFGIGPNAPITTGITLTFASEHPHILDISTFSSAYFVIFSTSLSAIFLSAGIATSIMRHSPF